MSTGPTPPVSSPAATPAPATDAGATLLRHFPDEIREAYRRFESHRQPADADLLVLAVVRDHIPDKALRLKTALEDHLQLIADLGFDSVAITEMVFFLEDLFRVRIGNDEILRVRTVGDLRVFVHAKVTNPPSTAPA